MATYTTPKTWTSEPLTSADLNTYLRDNMIARKDPPFDSYVLNEGSDYTETSTSFADVDATNLALTIITTGGNVKVYFHGSFYQGSGEYALDVAVDGVRHGSDDGILVFSGGVNIAQSFTRLIEGLAAGSHTFKLQWKISAGTATMHSGAGTSTRDSHPQFWVQEV